MKKMKLAVGVVFALLLLTGCTNEVKDKDEEVANYSIDIPLEQLFTDDVPKEFAASVIDTKVKDFEFESVFGNKKVSNKDFKGKPYIIKYAYTGCSSCQKSQPEVEKFVEDNPEIPIIQIFNESDTKKSIKNFLTLTGTFENDNMFIDNNKQSFAIKHNANYTPAFYFVDHTGIIRFATIGSVDKARLTAYMDLAFSKLPTEVYPRNKEKEDMNSTKDKK